MEKEIYLTYYPEDKEIHIWLTPSDETKIDSQYDNGISNQEKIMTLEHEQFFELYNTLAQVNIKEFLENNGAQQCTASSGVDEKNQHGVAHNDGLQDEQKREDFSPSSAPGDGDTDGATFEIAFGGFNDKVHFQLQVHKTNMEKRKVKKLCEAVKRILEIAEIDKNEYENDF